MKTPIKINNIWAQVLELVSKRSKFNTWSIASGWLETEFELRIINDDKIELVGTETRQAKYLLPGTFGYLARNWHDYCAGKITKADLKKISNVASYALPLIKLIEDGALETSKS